MSRREKPAGRVHEAQIEAWNDLARDWYLSLGQLQLGIEQTQARIIRQVPCERIQDELHELTRIREEIERVQQSIVKKHPWRQMFAIWKATVGQRVKRGMLQAELNTLNEKIRKARKAQRALRARRIPHQQQRRRRTP